MDFGDYLKTKVSEHILLATPFVAATSLYVALLTTVENDAGTAGVEVTGGSYARLEILGSTGRTFNSAGDNAQIWDLVQATSNWGTIVGISIRDALTGGNLYYHKGLDESRIIFSLDTFRFEIGDVNITHD